jgi:hypothetical protein
MTIKDYTVICETDENYQTEYVFSAESFHDCRVQAKEHGLMGDKPVRVERTEIYYGASGERTWKTSEGF